MGTGPHREHVRKRVCRRNASELIGVVDDRREEIDREHGRRRLIDFPHRRIVARFEPEEELVLVGQIDCRREAVQRIFEVARTPLCRSTALAGELRQRNFLLVAHGNLLSSRIQYSSAIRGRPFPSMPHASSFGVVAQGRSAFPGVMPFAAEEFVAGNSRASFLKIDGRGKINPF